MPSLFSKVKGHYWHARSGLENAKVGMVCLHNSSRFFVKLRWLMSDNYGCLDEDCLRNIFKHIFANGCQQWQGMF